MDGLRSLSSDNCGQQSALSQLSNINSAFIQDASIYKHQTQIPQNNIPLNQHLIPQSANQLTSDFAQHPRQAIPLPPPPQIISQQPSNVQKLYEAFHQQLNINSNTIAQQPLMNQPMMYPQPMMPMMNMNQPMFANAVQQYLPQNLPQMVVQQPFQKEELKTNGTKDVKDEKEVESEYSKPPIMEEKKENAVFSLENQFKGWTDPSIVDNMDWESYMNALDPEKNSDPKYTFAENNPYQESNDNKVADDVTVDYFSEGKKLMKEGLLNEAILAFEACVKKEEYRSEGWRYLGICHADNENDISAIAAFLKCYELDPYDLDALLQLGVSYTNEVDPFRAITFLRKWIANHTDYGLLAEQEQEPLQRKMMGNWLGSKAEQGRIIQLYGKALEINPQDPELHIVMGVLFNLTSEFNKAEMHFKKAIQARPTDASLWNKLGATQANGGNATAAIKAYSRALALKPNYVRVLSNLGISFANQNMHKEACQSYLASLKLNTNAEGVWDHLNISLMHLNRSNLSELCMKKDVTAFKNHFDF